MPNFTNSGARILDGLQGNDHLFGLGGDAWLMSDPTDPLGPNSGLIGAWADKAWSLSVSDASGQADIKFVAIMIDGSNQLIKSVELLGTGPGHVHSISMVAGDAMAIAAVSSVQWLNTPTEELHLVEKSNGQLGLAQDDGAGGFADLPGSVSVSTQANVAAGQLDFSSNSLNVSFAADPALPGVEHLVLNADVGMEAFNFLSIQVGAEGNDSLEGLSGADTLVGNDGDDLLVGGGAGDEWSFVNGQWVYDGSLVETPEADFVLDEADDVLIGGQGDDVLLGNRGADTLSGELGEDTLNGGKGADALYGGGASDTLNMEDGNDLGVGGLGADILNAGSGNDTLYGDLQTTEIVTGDPISTFEDMAASATWTQSGSIAAGDFAISRSITTEAGQAYTVEFGAAANFSADVSSGTVDVFWNGNLLETLVIDGALPERLSADFIADGATGILEIQINPDAADPTLNTSGLVATQDVVLQTADGPVEVASIAPGQSHVYQLNNGRLEVYNPSTQTLETIGLDPGFASNAAGYDIQTNLVYALATGSGFDSTGTDVSVGDLVAFDGNGATYRVGQTDQVRFSGDFDGNGNLWVVGASLDKIVMLDVDNIDADGKIHEIEIAIPDDAFHGAVYDVAFDASNQSFFGIQATSVNGGAARIVQLDVSSVANGGDIGVSFTQVSGTLVNGHMHTGVPAGDFGAAYVDANGDMFVVLNKGDHDFDPSTGQGAGFYKVESDPTTNVAYLELVADTERVTQNDGIIDPRATLAFNPISEDAAFAVYDFSVSTGGGDGDSLRGAEGDDQIFGGAGVDLVHAGEGQDSVDGGLGRDKVFGGDGDDVIDGGLDNDHIEAGTGHDTLFGGDGADFLLGAGGMDVFDAGQGADAAYGGQGDDFLQLGDGADRGFGGLENDEVHGEAGDDHLEGGGGNDGLIGGAGADFLKGGIGQDTLFGGEGEDVAYGNQGQDVLAGGQGQDKLFGGADNDVLDGGEGDDAAFGGDGGDDLQGGVGADHLFGGTGGDKVFGGSGSDKLRGGSGADTLSGGEGSDHLWGSGFVQDQDADIFIYSDGGGEDMIHDFSTPMDQIDLSSYGINFAELSERFNDLGWATEIDLSDFSSQGGIDKIIIRSVEATELEAANFIL